MSETLTRRDQVVRTHHAIRASRSPQGAHEEPVAANIFVRIELWLSTHETLTSIALET